MTFICLIFCTVDLSYGRPLLNIDGYSEDDNAVQHLSCLVKLQTLVITSQYMSVHLAEGLQGLRNMTAIRCLHLGPSSISVEGPYGMGGTTRPPG
jgi:hypothetical protein